MEARPKGWTEWHETWFERFWKEYPRRQKKKDARKAWVQSVREKGLVENILAAIALQKTSRQWRKSDGDFIPLPGTWLRAGQWEDEVQDEPKSGLSAVGQRNIGQIARGLGLKDDPS